MSDFEYGIKVSSQGLTKFGLTVLARLTSQSENQIRQNIMNRRYALRVDADELELVEQLSQVASQLEQNAIKYSLYDINDKRNYTDETTLTILNNEIQRAKDIIEAIENEADILD